MQAIHDGLARRGTYAVIVGRHFRAGSEGVLRQGVAGRLATEALNAHRGDGVTATLIDFVDRVAAAPYGPGTPERRRRTFRRRRHPASACSSSAAIAFLVFAFRQPPKAQAELAEVKAAAHDDLIALADDVQKLEEPVETNTEAKQEYEAALAAYDTATGAFDRAVRTKELEAVTSALEEGRYHMTVAEALLAGNTARAPAALFLRPAARPVDPRRRLGAAGRDAPPGSRLRSRRPGGRAGARAGVARGRGRRAAVPYWNAPPYFGPWAGGYFMPFGGTGFLSGLFVGELLGGAYGGLGYGSWGGSGDGGGFGSWTAAEWRRLRRRHGLRRR